MAFRLQIEYGLAFSLITARLQGSLAVIKERYVKKKPQKNALGCFCQMEGLKKVSCAATDIIIRVGVNLGNFLKANE